MRKINIAILDDDLMIVSLLKDFLSADENFNVIFYQTDGYELLNFVKNVEDAQNIDILLLDLKMKTINGLEVITELRNANFNGKIIVISSHYQESTVGFMTKQGVSAFLPKGIAPLELKKIIAHVAQFGYHFTPEQMEVLRGQISNKSPKPFLEEEMDFTERELKVLELLCQQKSAKEIGEILFISPRTVEGHKSNLLQKIGAKNLAGLIIYALQKGITKLDDLPIV